MYITVDYDKQYDMGILKTDFLENIRGNFSVEVKNINLLRKKFGRHLPNRKYAITAGGRFPINLFPEIVRYLKSLNTPFKLILSEEFKNKYRFSYDFIPDELDVMGILSTLNLKISPRDYQEDCLKNMFKYGRGIIKIATAGGKTPIFVFFSAIINHFKKQKILLVTLPNLVKQTYDEYINMGYNPANISMWDGDNDLNPDSKIVICNNYILYNQLSDAEKDYKKNKALQKLLSKHLQTNSDDINNYKKWTEDIIKLKDDEERLKRLMATQLTTHAFFKSIDVLLIDETHMVKKDNEINTLLEYVKTPHRYGFTGTLPADKIDEWSLIGNIGPIITNVERQILIDQDHISDFVLKVLKIKYSNSPAYKLYTLMPENDDETNVVTENYEIESDFLFKNKFRNNIIKKVTHSFNKNTLILVDRIAHCDILYDTLKDLTDRQVFYIQGKTEDDIRDEIKLKIETDNNVICIAMSKIFSTGINLKNIHYIVMASSGKAKEKLIQSLGRGLRKHQTKTKLVFVDIFDDLKYGNDHFKERIDIYAKDNIRYEIKEIKESVE